MVGRPSIRLQPTNPLTSPHEGVTVITGSYAKTDFHQLSDTTTTAGKNTTVTVPAFTTDSVSHVQRPQKRVTVITTGGTIAETLRSVPNRRHLTAEDLLRQLPPIQSIETSTVDLFDLPSTFITFDHMLQIAAAVDAAVEKGEDGVVITHGTATLEETAYFVDLVYRNERPVVFTGAMLPPEVPGADGSFNLRNALLIAASEEACSRGVLVTLSAEIHAAQDVAKTHSMNLGAFKSRDFGPLGSVDEDRVVFCRSAPPSERLPVSEVTARIEGVKCYASMSDIQLRALTKAGVDGVVLETFGSGQVPPSLMPAIREAIGSGVVIVATTRCPSGHLSRNHFGQSDRVEGDGRDLLECGVIFSNLQGPKARIKLALGLSAGLGLEHFRRFF